MRYSLFSLLCLVMSLATITPSQAAEPKSLFDGKTLDGWKGRSDLWTVSDGAIVGTTTSEAPLKFNTFLIYEGDMPSDFELTAKFLIKGGNSGIQYRSKVMNEADFVVGGYQADIDASLTFAGINYEEKGRGILAQRGEKVTIAEDGKKAAERFGDAKEIGKVIKDGEWNDYKIIAKGNRLQHYINGTLTSEVIDEQSSKSSSDGVLALQIHTGPPMVIMFKDLSLTPLAE